MKAAEICAHAATLVNGHRNATHGPRERNMANIAVLWNGYLSIRKEPAAPLTSTDVALMMALMKVARTQLGDHNADDLLDGVGYLAIAGEISMESHRPDQTDRSPSAGRPLAPVVFKQRGGISG